MAHLMYAPFLFGVKDDHMMPINEQYKEICRRIRHLEIEIDMKKKLLDDLKVTQKQFESLGYYDAIIFKGNKATVYKDLNRPV